MFLPLKFFIRLNEKEPAPIYNGKTLMRPTLLFLSLLVAGAAGAAGPDLGKQADQDYGLRDDSAKARECLALYQQIVSEQPSNVEAMWKGSRIAHWIGEHAESRSEKLTVFHQGMDLAQRAVSIDSSCVDGYFWLAGNSGSYGKARGILESLKLLHPIRRELETVLRLNDRFQGGAGYLILGVVDYNVPFFAGGNKKRARQELLKALAIDPTNGFNNYYMAEFEDVVGHRAEARKRLEAVERAGPSDGVDPADIRMIQKKGEALKKSLGG